jgi:hypothetical protein
MISLFLPEKCLAPHDKFIREQLYYAGKRGIGHFFGELVKKYDVEEHY